MSGPTRCSPGQIPPRRTRPLALMRRFVAATPVAPEAFQAAMISAYAARSGLGAVAGELTGTERAAVGDLDERFNQRHVAGRTGQARSAAGAGPRVRRVKVRGRGVDALGDLRRGTGRKPAWSGERSTRCDCAPAG